MAAESNVGARLFLIGKDATLAGLKEITAATARLNAEIAAGAKASRTAAAGMGEEDAALTALAARQDLYKANLLESTAATNALAKVGKTAFFGLAAAGAVWGYESIRWAQNYQTQLVRLRTQAGLTVSSMNAIGKAAMANAASLGTTPTAYLTAAYHPASTGMGVRETIAITNNAAKLAAIGGAPIEDTTNALTGIMKSYNSKPGQAERTAALLNAAVGAGNMRFSDLNSALASGIASTSKTFGISQTSFLGALAFMTDRGVPASQAGTHLRMSEALLGAPSGEATKILTAAGLSSSAAASDSNAMAQMLQSAGVTTTQLSSALRNNAGGGGIANALGLLHRTLSGSGLSPEMQAATISRAFGGGRMGSTIAMMYNNVPGLAAKTGQIDKNGTNAKLTADWNAETKTLDFQLKKLGGTVETLGTQFGLVLIPPLTEGLKLLSSMIGFLDRNKGVAIALGGAITGVLVPAIGLYLYRALLSSGGAIRSVIRGYGQLISGQTAEQVSLARTDGALGTTTLATERLGAADAGLAGTSRTAGGMGSRLLTAGGYALGGVIAGGLIRGKNGATDNPRASRSNQLRTFGGDVAEGAGLGAAVGSIVPGVGTLLGAGIGATGGAVYAEHRQIGHAITSGWDDLFGHGTSSNNAKPLNLRVENHVYLNNKEITKGVQTRTKAVAART